MPGNLHPALPSLVMPMSLAVLFEESLVLDAAVNEFADGRSIRRAMAFNCRHIFRLGRRLRDYELEDLRGFYYSFARHGNPFWFYNTRETLPLFSWDATGSDPVGRYTVVWAGPWSESIGMRLHDTSFELREVV
jgi:hypothetical protein